MVKQHSRRPGDTSAMWTSLRRPGQWLETMMLTRCSPRGRWRNAHQNSGRLAPNVDAEAVYPWSGEPTAAGLR